MLNRRLIVNKNGNTKLQVKQKIPYNIIQTFKTREVPSSMYINTAKWCYLNQEYNYLFFDDDDILKYISTYNFNKINISKDTFLIAYNKIKPGSGKADLFRLLVIYDIGGCYIDIDTTPLVPLNQIIKPIDEVVSGVGERGDFHQWCLIYIKNHPFIKRTLQLAVSNIINKTFINNIKSLEYLCGPPVLDIGIKSILGYDKKYKFKAGYYCINNISYTLLPGNYLNNTIIFKYKNYKTDLKLMGITYWQNDNIFNY